jgi:hypothetical protein
MTDFMRCEAYIVNGERRCHCTRHRGHLGPHYAKIEERRAMWGDKAKRSFCIDKTKSCGHCDGDRPCFDFGDLEFVGEDD